MKGIENNLKTATLLHLSYHCTILSLCSDELVLIYIFLCTFMITYIFSSSIMFKPVLRQSLSHSFNVKQVETNPYHSFSVKQVQTGPYYSFSVKQVQTSPYHSFSVKQVLTNSCITRCIFYQHIWCSTELCYISHSLSMIIDIPKRIVLSC